MLRIVFLLLFVLCAEWSSAQIRPDDVLIGRKRYEQLKEQARLGEIAIKRLDSLKTASFEFTAEYRMHQDRNARELQNTYNQLYDREMQVKRLQSHLAEQRKQTNKYRYAYQTSGRTGDKLTTALLWGGFMSAAFLLSMGDNYPTESIIISAGGVATTLTLAFVLGKKKPKAPDL